MPEGYGSPPPAAAGRRPPGGSGELCSPSAVRSTAGPAASLPPELARGVGDSAFPCRPGRGLFHACGVGGALPLRPQAAALRAALANCVRRRRCWAPPGLRPSLAPCTFRPAPALRRVFLCPGLGVLIQKKYGGLLIFCIGLWHAVKCGRGEPSAAAKPPLFKHEKEKPP